MEVKFGVEPLYLGQKMFVKNLFFELYWPPGCQNITNKKIKSVIFYTPGTPLAQKTDFFQRNFAQNKVAPIQILLPHPTAFLTSRASFTKK